MPPIAVAAASSAAPAAADRTAAARHLGTRGTERLGARVFLASPTHLGESERGELPGDVLCSVSRDGALTARFDAKDVDQNTMGGSCVLPCDHAAES